MKRKVRRLPEEAGHEEARRRRQRNAAGHPGYSRP